LEDLPFSFGNPPKHGYLFRSYLDAILVGFNAIPWDLTQCLGIWRKLSVCLFPIALRSSRLLDIIWAESRCDASPSFPFSHALAPTGWQSSFADSYRRTKGAYAARRLPSWVRETALSCGLVPASTANPNRLAGQRH
jgi:hypothetical protein